MTVFPTTPTTAISTTAWACRTPIWAAMSRPDGSVIEGPSLSALVAAADPAHDAEMRARLDTTMAALGAIKTRRRGRVCL